MRLLDDDSKSISHLSYQSLNLNSYYNINGKKMKVIEKRDDTQNGLRAYAFAPVKMVNLIKSILLWDMLAQILSVFMIYLQMLNFDFIITQKPKINNYYKI